MSAKETFEKLGYVCTEYSDCICYCKGILEDYIWFYKNAKIIEITVDINIQELQAINKQVEELWGGNNEK